MSRPPVDPQRRCLKFEDWPETDQLLWQTGTAPNDDFDCYRRAADLSPRTLLKTRQGYGRWLGFLTIKDPVSLGSAPEERITPANVRAFLHLMRSLGNRDYTIFGRIVELKEAMRVMRPDLDFGWLTQPGERSLWSSMPMSVQQHEIHDSRLLYQWGLDLMKAAAYLTPTRRRVLFRDGLLIAILAVRAPRLRSTTAMCFGQHVVRSEKDFRLVFAVEDMKTERSLAYPLPSGLAPYIERYLAVERVELLKGQTHDAFWVNWSGDPLGEVGIEKRIRWHSVKAFGKAFGPHRFRHALGTTQALVDPANPAAGAAILGISAEMVEKHYNIGGQAQAAMSFTASVQEARRETAEIARRAFGDQEGDGDD